MTHHAVVATSPVKAGDVLDGKYRVERILGAGGMGVVVVATHLELEQQVAIKFLLPSVAKNAEAVARFAREARAAAKIQSEHVTRVLDVAKLKNGAPYMVMEYLEGHDLEHILDERGLPIDRVVDYMLQALEALAEAHVAGIVHRDLKPANLFLARRADGSSVVKVLDFGISKLIRSKDPAITTTSVQMGSPLYMSPEQLRSSRDVDARADIWAIGVILHELITGEPPFGGNTLAEVVAAILAVAPLSMRLRRPDAPAALEAVVLRCLDKNPGARFPDVAQLAVALAPFGPERSRLSVERIVRVIAGRRETSVSPQVDLPSSSASPSSVLHTAVTSASWQTSGVLRSVRNGRRIVVATVAGVIVAAVVASAIVLARRPDIVAPPPVAVVARGTATAGPAPASAPPATAPAPSIATIAVTELPAVPVAPRPAATRPTTSAATPTATASVATTATPVPATSTVRTPPPTSPGTPDFGGRK